MKRIAIAGSMAAALAQMVTDHPPEVEIPKRKPSGKDRSKVKAARKQRRKNKPK
ncbi:hypothetical protein RIdsm_02563 [Roseovarius indicus]|uniref:Uncharacterized protein n=1 Tax=Roseovarius indicus TaxID=540747 RepID=A0A1I1TVL2_9RHOB|nr:hypothetical protein [Roseovarius indicus]QEW26758.1 hypothetical protein RIdsm_02560 [Roseovarius indicus]QEW26761.1 hypothetical protein RIdsm_02563 [Roseovarius indicus]SFD60493.1 hypothetical protein SAMN04488031_101780 [Roseovarius indicus]SFD60540.1 hypothetical protein SAMN04488031_101783 [Roseovarius indicus]